MEDILLIDDDVELCNMLTEYLGRYDLQVHAVHRGDIGLEAARSRTWPMILLDVMLPGIDGFEVLTRLRTFSSDSVLLLTARGEDVDRIVGLEMGADDYLAKPFNARELLARIRAIRRRTTAPAPTESSTLVVEDLILDPASRTVRQDPHRSHRRRVHSPRSPHALARQSRRARGFSRICPRSQMESLRSLPRHARQPPPP
jgi:two-component system response regulator CpxR